MGTWQVYSSAELYLSAGDFEYFSVQIGYLAKNLSRANAVLKGPISVMLRHPG